MSVKRHRYAAATTLVEAMVTVVVLAIAALGALSYEYHAAKHARIAQAEITATRTARILVEDWKNTGGSEDYDPTTLGMGFSCLIIPPYFSEGPGIGEGAPLHNAVYAITIDDFPVLIMLTWNDVAHDSIGQVTLRQLAVIVKWQENSDAPPIILTTYVRLDAAGG